MLEVVSSDDGEYEGFVESCVTQKVEKSVDDDAVEFPPPKVGMTFNSWESARECYNRYGYAVGFGTKLRGTYRRGEGEVWKCIFACTKEGVTVHKEGKKSRRHVDKD